MKLFTLLLFFVIPFTISAQNGKIEGKVTDALSGKPLAGVSVVIDGLNKGVSTNLEGYFLLTGDAGQKYTLRLSLVNYKTKEVSDIEVDEGKVSNVDIVMEISHKSETEVILRSSGRKESVAALISYQRTAPVVAQVVSAEAIRRSPDKNTGEVLKRVPGTSIQEGKYLVVRGLADRYNQAMLNGILLGSTEPDRKTFSFDIIPASMLDNIIINKAFIPELPGEWAGGLIQVNTKDVPSRNFLNVQIGTGFNTQTVGHEFYSYEGSNTDFLGYDNGKRALPSNLPSRSNFAALTQEQKTAYAKDFENIWAPEKSNSSTSALFNQSFSISGGINKKIGKNTLAAVLGVNYHRNIKRATYGNMINTFDHNVPDPSFDYLNTKYSKDILAGALANITLQMTNHKITFKNLLNVNTTNYTTIRTGLELDNTLRPEGDQIRATELAFKANTFFNTQLAGDHNFKKIESKLHWYGSFNILDQYVPDQRRLQYIQDDINNPDVYRAVIGGSNASQKSGSRYFGYLSDYNYTAGGDVSKIFRIHDFAQTVKAGYFFQVKDRLFNSRPFAIYLPQNNDDLRSLTADKIFAAENFGNGTDNKFALNELSGSTYRYIANSILNAGFIQLDNQFGKKLRAVWGMRIENFDQVIGSVRKSDPRHLHNIKTDYLPGVNITYKLNNNTNLRVSGSQTVIRPEFRELSTFQFYDFDLGATVAGNAALERTKVSNFDLRFELYPRGGELLTFGVFYKYFKKPIEVFLNTLSGAGSSTYNFFNADEANSFGAELEFRKKLDFNSSLKNFTVQGNFAYIYNRVTSDLTSLDRPMQGQSPYLLNAGIQYDIEKYGISTTLLFNQIGRRIAYVGGSDAGSESDTPPIWENPRPVLDFQLAKKVLKSKGEIKLNVSDIFNKAAIFYNDLNLNNKYDAGIDAFAIKRKSGTNVSLSFGYDF